MNTATARPTVFVSYSHQDEAWKDRLVKQLRVLELEGDLEVWDDRRIAAGDDWQAEIEEAMAEAQAAVLLISADFLISEFIRSKEVPELLRRHESEGLRVIPLIVDPCAWTAVPWLSQMQGRPKGGKPLASFARAKAEQHLADLVLEIRDLLAVPPLVESKLKFGARGLHNLPYPSLNDLFTGRQEELDALFPIDTAESAVLFGLGGIGKTRLAVEYAWRSGTSYTAAWFVRADSPENLRRNIAALAGPNLLDLPEWEAQVEERTVTAVERWLREHLGWLMILDSVETPEAASAVVEILPALSTGHVLITSRLTSWPPEVRKQPIEKLSQGEAVRFLLQRTEGERESTGQDTETASLLAQRIDGLPLALEQAAAYIVRHRMRIADYLQAWEVERQRVIQWFDPQVMRYPASVAVTWQHTFQQLTPTAGALLRLTAFLAPDPIPVEILEQGAREIKDAAALFSEESGKSPDGKSIREAIAELAGFSLVEQKDGRTILVHRIVQDTLRGLIPEDRRKSWTERALRSVNSAAVDNPRDVRTWPLWDRLRPHVAHVVALADQEGIVEPTNRLMNDLAVFLLAKGLYSEAGPLMRRTLAIGEASFGPEHPEVAIYLNNLAALFQATGHLDEAEPLMRRALAIDEACLGPEHPNVSIRLNNLAQLLQDTDHMPEAEPLMRRALAIDEGYFGKDQPNVARDLSNLAQLLTAMNRREEAEPLMRRALAIDQAAFGNDHPNVAIRLNSLALLLRATNRLDEAEALMRRALAIDKTFFDSEHPTIASRLSNLAQLLQAMNRSAEAEPLLRRALEIREKRLGSDHPKTRTARENLATLMAKMTTVSKENPMKDFFISFNSADRSWADWIAWVLEEAKYSVVYQPWDFRPGGNFVLEMQKAASEARKTVIVLSDHYLNADYTQPEWAAAFVDDPRGEQRKLIPFRVEKCSPTGLLKPLIYADLVGLTPEKAKETVLSAVSDARPKPSQEPGFPGKATTPGHPAPVAFPGTPAPTPQAATTPQRTSGALALWQEKLEFLREEEAIAVDAAQKFAIRKQIKEAEEKIRELNR